MQWLNEPASWQRTGDVLRVSVDPGTDFWRTTGYGYIHDNGHVYGDLLPGDLDVSVRVRGTFANQYDQAGIMLRADEQTWLKTGVEFFEGRPRLSTVLTVGWSSWMVADLPPGLDEVALRVSRRGDAVEVRYAIGEGPAELAALVFLPPERELLAGIVCAAPEGTGFSVTFHDLRIVAREWGAQGAGWVHEQDAGTGAGWDGSGADWAAGVPAGGGPPAWAGDAPDKAQEAAPGWAEEIPGEAPVGWRDDPPGNAAFDWGNSQASDAAQDWERLSLSVTGGAGRSADQADEPAGEQPGKPAADQPDKPAADQPDKPAADHEAGQPPGDSPPEDSPPGDSDDSTGEQPETPGPDGKRPQAQAPAPAHDHAGGSPPAAATTGGLNPRGRGNAKLPAPRSPARSEPAGPADAADEWISLLTAADPAEETTSQDLVGQELPEQDSAGQDSAGQE
jgi:uncharacterized protein